MKRRLLSILCALALCLGLLPMTASAAGVDYIERSWDSSTNTVKSEPKNSPDTTTEVTANDTQWSSGWYVAQGEVTIGQRVTVTGDVHLILADNCALTVNGGIQVAENNSLTIYGQENDTGTLRATVSDSKAGIGGNNGETAGTITIHGGTVEAKSNGSNTAGAGIGGGYGGSGGTVTIYGGTVTANGSNRGAGIGGGWYGAAGGNINIYGGTVNATGGISGAGIGGGEDGAGGNINIYGGTAPTA